MTWRWVEDCIKSIGIIELDSKGKQFHPRSIVFEVEKNDSRVTDMVLSEIDLFKNTVLCKKKTVLLMELLQRQIVQNLSESWEMIKK